MIIDDNTATKRCTFMLPADLVVRIDALKRDVKKLNKKFDITRDIERAVSRDERIIAKFNEPSRVNTSSEASSRLLNDDVTSVGG